MGYKQVFMNNPLGYVNDPLGHKLLVTNLHITKRYEWMADVPYHVRIGRKITAYITTMIDDGI